MINERPAGRRIVLKQRPQGLLQPTDFAVEAQPAAEPGEGEFLVANRFVSVDPMLRLFVDASPLGGLLPPLPLGATVPGPAVGEVIESRHPDYAPGTLVEGRFGWASYATSNGQGVNRVDPALGGPENALGVGGLPGFTAFCGLEAAGGVSPGRTFLVSGAGGAVGSVVGPMVRARGGRAVGIVGGADKARRLVEAGAYDAAADRTAPDFADQLKAALPNGAEVYFDNVGGPMLAQVLPHLARGALVLISGLMAQYEGEAAGGPDNLPALLRAVMGNGVRVQGFTQFGRDVLRPAFYAEVGTLLASGALRPEVHVEHGLERLPDALCGLFSHARTGKVVVRVTGENE